MIPPNVSGTITTMNCVGDNTKDIYTVEDVILQVKAYDSDKIIDIKLAHYWPVRKPRPVAKKLAGKEALITGQRIIDTIFPSVLGGTCAVPGAFGCGKTVISQALSKYANTNGIIYVGCGERGNEMAEVLSDFPALKTTFKGVECDGKYFKRKRTCIAYMESTVVSISIPPPSFKPVFIVFVTYLLLL